MSVQVRREGSTAVIAVQGKLSLGAPVDEFRAKWSDALATGAKNVCVKLDEVPMVDSSGIGSLIRCHSAVSAAGGKMSLAGANDVVRQAFKVTRLDRVFTFMATEEEAVATMEG
jgi:anti-sigma B factor antagonist